MDNFNENSHLNAEGKPIWYMNDAGYRMQYDYRPWYVKFIPDTIAVVVAVGVVVATIFGVVKVFKNTK